MTKDEKNKIKSFLNRPRVIMKSLSLLEREYNQKKKEIDSIGVCNSEIRGNTIMSNVENKALELVELEKDINIHNLLLMESKSRIEVIIDKIDEDRHKKILKWRYLEYKNWSAIAELLGCSEQHLHRIHNNILKNIKLIFKNVILC